MNRVAESFSAFADWTIELQISKKEGFHRFRALNTNSSVSAAPRSISDQAKALSYIKRIELSYT